MTKLELWLQVFLAALQAFAQNVGLTHQTIASNARALADEAVTHVPANFIQPDQTAAAPAGSSPELDALKKQRDELDKKIAAASSPQQSPATGTGSSNAVGASNT